MWQCDNCGYTDEDGTTFEEEVVESSEASDEAQEAVRYCPECGSDEVFLVEEEDDPVPVDDAEDEEEDLDWESNGDGDDDDEAEEW